MQRYKPVKFLLVDDLEDNLLALEALLCREGLELFKAHSGQEALELLLVHDFALALLDVQMPGMTGFELAELMRATERTRRIPIVFLTAVATDERRRFRGYEAGAVDYLLKPADPQILRHKAEVFFELDRHRQELASQRDELQEATARLAEALGRIQAHSDNSPLAIVELDPEFRLLGWSQGAERIFGWRAEEVIGRRIVELAWFGEAEEGHGLAALCADMQAGRRLRDVRLHRVRRKDGALIDCEWYSSALLDAGGRLLSVNSQVLDVTERRRAQEIQRLLIGELNHRVKNTLATVQAIAMQTLRHTTDPAEFTAKFSGRIQALARAHSLLSERTWRGAGLAELVRDQLRLGEDESRLKVSGPEIQLPPQPALHLALILHELGTNARKHGALSGAGGGIALTWSVDRGFLRLSWVESGGVPLPQPVKRGFGTALIEQSVRSEGGDARVFHRADGLTWRLRLALPAAYGGRSEAAGEGAVQRTPQTGGGTGELSGRRLLVVEDEAVVGLELVSLLADAGAEVIGPVGSADRAIEAVAGAPFDGALLDCNLQGCSVDAVAAALVRHGVPFLFVSGYGRESLPAAFARTPMIGKPFNHRQLLEAIRHMLGREPQDMFDAVSSGTAPSSNNQSLNNRGR